MKANAACRLVQAIGVTPVENIPSPLRWFTEVTIPETVKIPKAKPDIEALVSVAVEAEVLSVRLINTSEGTSNEGQHLSGRKLIVELKLKQKVKYIADEPTQSVHAAHFEKVISSIFVVVLKEYVWGGVPYTIEELFKMGNVIVTPYIEDIYADLRDKRTIFKNVTVLINVNVIQP